LAMKVVVRRELWFTSGLNSSGNTHTVNICERKRQKERERRREEGEMNWGKFLI